MATPMISTETVEVVTVCDAATWTYPADKENMIRTCEAREYVTWLNEVIFECVIFPFLATTSDPSVKTP